MAVGQQSNQQAIDHVGLPHDGAPHLCTQCVHKLTFLRNQGIQGLNVRGLILSSRGGDVGDKAGAFRWVHFVHDTRRYLPQRQARNVSLKIV